MDFISGDFLPLQLLAGWLIPGENFKNVQSTQK